MLLLLRLRVWLILILLRGRLECLRLLLVRWRGLRKR